MRSDDSSTPPAPAERSERLWCAACARSIDEAEGGGGDRCPACGGELGPPPPVPWHFKLLVLAVVLYLAYRAWQGVAWLVAHL